MAVLTLAVGRREKMRPNSKGQMVARERSRPDSAEQRLKELGSRLPAPPEPFGT
jgi:hypothetical protein